MMQQYVSSSCSFCAPQNFIIQQIILIYQLIKIPIFDNLLFPYYQQYCYHNIIRICIELIYRLIIIIQYKMSSNSIYTWKKIGLIHFLLVFLLSYSLASKAPFVQINTVHQAYSEFQVNLIFNENRNHPIIMTTISTDAGKKGAQEVMEEALVTQKYGGFGILIDCRQYAFNLNRTLGICNSYDPNAPVDETYDPNFSCQFMIPQQTKIKEKGHILMKNHLEERLESGKVFTAQYLSDMIKKNIPDFVKYIEDFYDLEEFLQKTSEIRSAKRPKLLYFDENLLAPPFIKKLSALLDGKITIGVSDQIKIGEKYSTTYEELVLFEYNFTKNDYNVIPITIDQNSQIQSVLNNPKIQRYTSIKKFRDILLDFEHSDSPIYNFSEIEDVWNLQTHSRIILLEISSDEDSYKCETIKNIAQEEVTLFNYICYEKKSIQSLDIDFSRTQNSILLINDQITNGLWVPKSEKSKILDYLPKTIARQRIETQTESQLCMRTALVSNRDPILYYFNEKTHSKAIKIMNYLNSLPEVTALQFFCQFYLPDAQTVRKFTLKPNTMFTLSEPTSTGEMKKMEHTEIKSFIEIKMFLREIAIKKMLKAYEDRLIYNKVAEIKSNEDLADKCFTKNCIIGIIASGRYRQEEEMNILKQLKLQYEEQYQFVWIDGICHWDVAKQLKMLKKKEKVIERSYVIFYNEKQRSYALWKSTKFWDVKSLNRWIKSLRNARNKTRLRFAIDIEDRQCKKQPKAANEEL